MASAPVFRFGPFRLDAASGELRRAGRPVRLRPKTVAMLRHLVENAGRTVTKRELLDAVWPDVAVGDAVLKVGVRELREALGDDAATPRYIATAHRSGYRFVCAVEVEGLPYRLTRFVGREREIAAIRAVIEGGARLVTLTGVGGAGKSRLALETARASRESRPGGVAWIELATVEEPKEVVHGLAETLGVREHGRRELVDHVAAWLRARSLLLVLDNCEHVRDAVAALTRRLLAEAPGLTILATSREPLGLEGETVWPVPPLALPDRAADPRGAESVRLFVDRARTVRPAIELGDEDVAAVADVCRHLDGLPLAIELAAARIAVLSPAELLARLGDTFAVLGAGPSDRPRQRTLRAVIDSSHEALAVEEKRLFRRLATFAGSFTLDAAIAVAADRSLPHESVLDALGRLIEKSMVATDRRGPGGATRYRMLEVVRQYAAARRHAAGEVESCDRRHVAFFAELAEREAPRIDGTERADALARLDADLPDLRAAIERDFRGGGASGARDVRRLAAALVWYWFYRGHWGEGRRILARVRALTSSSEDVLAAIAAFGEGLIAWTQGDLEVADASLGAAVAAFRRSGDEPRLGVALDFHSATQLSLGRAAAALALSAESVEIAARHPGLAFVHAAAFANRGIILMGTGAPGAARDALERAEAASRASGETWILSLAVRNLGVLAAREGDLAAAEKRITESLVLLLDSGERWFVSRAIEMLASVLARRGESDRAALLYGAGEALREEIGASVVAIYREDHDAGIARLRERLGAGALAERMAEGRRLGLDGAIALALG